MRRAMAEGWLEGNPILHRSDYENRGLPARGGLRSMIVPQRLTTVFVWVCCLSIAMTSGCGGGTATPESSSGADNANLDLSAIHQDSNADPERISAKPNADQNADSVADGRDPPSFDADEQYHIDHDLFLAVDDPFFTYADKVDFLDDDDEVLGFVLDGVARAYSVRALSYHHVVNDMIGETPIAVAY